MTHFISKAAKVLFFSAAATMLLAGFAMAAEEDMAVAVGATTGSSLRLRAEASTSADIVATLDKGVAVSVLDNTLDGWYQVAFNGNTGFVSADYMVIDQDNVFESYGRVNANGVNVRADANTDSEILASIDTDTIVTVNGFVDGWYDVTCKYGTEGYIHSDFLDLTASKNPAKLSPTPLRSPKIPPKIAPFHPICKQTLKPRLWHFKNEVGGLEKKRFRGYLLGHRLCNVAES